MPVQAANQNWPVIRLCLSAHTLDAAKAIVPGGNMSAFVDRALRNETLRTQLATNTLPELGSWLDDAETDQVPAA